MKIGDTQIEAIKGDIVTQSDIEAIVNAANAQLQTGSGVAGAIHKAAGPDLDKETSPLAPIKPGDAVITRAYNLPNDFVIHVLGPIYGTDKPEEDLLSNCYKNAIQLAEERKIKSIAFPAISTGAFGYPLEEATNVTLSTVKVILPTLKHVKLVRFVLFSEKDLALYQQKIEALKDTL
ncbi:RNase III inhibitor [Marivirga lumbricoides]|uniref:RNase III inhibitor n=1 Tax=Marivirga lumbricoides TaxID=1046115 RepID=A0A2T4DVR2_9BACT|nr:RNase III inhibitor [Marivirga lumbricoides]